ncbi:MAG: hypothetical protein J5781_06465 [Clostridia bacterium]|nr:hypothetical protein [Clostridia bacterium]
MSKRDVIVLIVCLGVWLGTLIALFFVRELAATIVAIPHALAILGIIVLTYKYVPAPRPKKKDPATEQEEKKAEQEIFTWDVIDDE